MACLFNGKIVHIETPSEEGISRREVLPAEILRPPKACRRRTRILKPEIRILKPKKGNDFSDFVPMAIGINFRIYHLLVLTGKSPVSTLFLQDQVPFQSFLIFHHLICPRGATVPPFSF